MDATELLRSRRYLVLLVFGAGIGLPISVVAFGFLSLIHYVEEWVYHDLPAGFGFDQPPWWWPLPALAVAGLLTGLAVKYLPGGGGHSPAEGFHPGAPSPRDLLGVFLAAGASLGLGAVLGPEAPLIALGGGLAIWAINLLKRDAPASAVTVISAAGSFAAISTLLGSPIAGAFLLMEVAAVSGPMLSTVLIPGLLASGIGALIFVGLGTWTGLGTLSLAVPNLPPVPAPNLTEFAWAIVIGIVAAVVGSAVRRASLAIEQVVRRRVVTFTVAAGIVVAAIAVTYQQITDHSAQDVLFSGQNALGPLLTQSETYAVGTLIALIAAKLLAYCISLAAFRGGPIFPAMFSGAAGGILFSHLPGLTPIAGAAIGIGAMSVAMLRLPLTSVLISVLFLGTDGINVTPLVIVAVVTAHVASARLTPLPSQSVSSEPSPGARSTP